MWLNRIFVNIRRNKKIKEINPEDIFAESSNVSKFDDHNFEGRFESPIDSKMFLFLGALCAVMVIFFISKAYKLQVAEYDTWFTRATKNYIKKTPIFAYRGVIKDRNGVLLAWNEKVEGNDSTSTDIIPKRRYIEDEGFGNVLGFVSYPKKDSSGIFWQDNYIGGSGLEKKYDQDLSGVSGERVLEISANGTVERDNIINDSKEGEPLVTNLDSKVQSIFYKHIEDVVKAKGFQGGAGAMMDVNTGEVIAMVSYPDYDNNLFTNASTSEEKEIKAKYLTDKTSPMTNKVVSGLFTPGSVVKPFMLYAALVEGVIDEWKNIYSSGKSVIKNKYGGPDTVFRDWKAHGYVDARKAIAQSSDEYFYQIGGGYQDQPGLGIKRIEKYANMFGFASGTGIDMPVENIGVVPSPEWKAKNFKEGDWLLGNTYHTSIGQYGFQVTPIELLRYIASLANGGKLVTPKLVNNKNKNENISQSDPLNKNEEQSKNQDVTDLNLNKKHLKTVQEAMLAAASEGGTAHYFSDLPFKVGAKTGTAQLGYNNEYVNSWTTGYWPYENPKYSFVFLMEKGPASNTTGASKIMRQIFTDMLTYTPEYMDFK